MADNRSQREKLEAMAHQSASPNEAKVAEHILFKRYGHRHGDSAGRARPEGHERSAFEFVGDDDAWDRAMGRKPSEHPKESRTPPYFRSKTGTQDDVLDAFLRGDLAKSRKAHVPGDRRQSIRLSGSASDDKEGGTDLYSYNTVVAHRSSSGGYISTTTAKYSTTTSKMMSNLRRKMAELGYEPSGEQHTVHSVRNMGRWGGMGPSWGPDFSDILFDKHTRPKNRLHG